MTKRRLGVPPTTDANMKLAQDAARRRVAGSTPKIGPFKSFAAGKKRGTVTAPGTPDNPAEQLAKQRSMQEKIKARS